MSLSIFEGLFLPEYGAATNCTEAMEDTIDQSVYHWKNRTFKQDFDSQDETNEDQKIERSNTFLNLTAMASDSLSRFTLYCPSDMQS